MKGKYNMKAVILAAGRGKRLKEVTEQSISNKCMLKFNNKPLLEYSLNAAVLCDIKEIIIVVGYRAEEIINTYGINYNNVQIRYVIQQEQKGLVHAIEQCQEAIGNEDFILFLGDELLINPNPMEMVKKFKSENLFVICGVTEVEDKSQIRNTYSVIYSTETNEIYRLIEKPRNPVNNLMGTGNCILKNEIFNYIPYTPINQTRHEKELPDLIQCAIDDGKPVKLFRIASYYVNINTPDEINRAENLFQKN